MATLEERLSEPAIRVLETIEEFNRTPAAQQAIWGFSETDQVPPRLMLVASRIGGFTLGAFSGDALIGFSFAMPGRKPNGRAYLHSHMTGVLPTVQNRGLGRRLKLRQRLEALARGCDLIEWTFDPLEIRNAFFNVERLGVVVRRYEPNLYGVTSSRLHGGLPTDRLVAEWRLESPRVHTAVDRRPGPRPAVIEEIAIPASIGELRGSDPAAALAIQNSIRERFEQAFGRGLAVVGFGRGPEGGAFQLGHED